MFHLAHQIALTAGISGAVIEGGGEFIDELQDGEPINWGAVAARTVGGGAKGAIFSVPGLGTAKLAAGTVGIAKAENYLHSAAKGDVSAEALGKALADGTIEGVTVGLVDHAAKKILGPQPHAEPKPELQMQPMSEAELEATCGGTSDPKWNPHGSNQQIIHNRFPNEPQMGKEFDYIIKDGKLLIRDGIQEVDFIVDMDSKLHIGRGHSFLANGKDVRAAGKMKINSQGYVRYIKNFSGHYTPTIEQCEAFSHILNKLGIRTQNAWLELGEYAFTTSGYVDLTKTVIYSQKLK